jgi:hypothetical protein
MLWPENQVVPDLAHYPHLALRTLGSFLPFSHDIPSRLDFEYLYRFSAAIRSTDLPVRILR